MPGHTRTWRRTLCKRDIEQAKQEIEQGVERRAHGDRRANCAVLPFLPICSNRVTPMPYLGTRNTAIFSTDIDSFDFKLHKPEDVVKSMMTKLAKC